MFLRLDPAFDKDVQDCLGVQVGTNAHVSDLVYADDIVPLNNYNTEMHGVREELYRPVAGVGMHVNVPNPKAFVLNEQYHVDLLDSEPLEVVEKFKILGKMPIANGQGTEEVKSKLNFVSSAFSRNPVLRR